MTEENQSKIWKLVKKFLCWLNGFVAGAAVGYYWTEIVNLFNKVF